MGTRTKASLLAAMAVSGVLALNVGLAFTLGVAADKLWESFYGHVGNESHTLVCVFTLFGALAGAITGVMVGSALYEDTVAAAQVKSRRRSVEDT